MHVRLRDFGKVALRIYQLHREPLARLDRLGYRVDICMYILHTCADIFAIPAGHKRGSMDKNVTLGKLRDLLILWKNKEQACCANFDPPLPMMYGV